MSGSNASDAKDLYSSFNLGTISIGTRPLRIIEHDNPDNERIVGVTYYAFNDEVGEILINKSFFDMCLELYRMIYVLKEQLRQKYLES